jgi:hypothetical protein
MGYHWSFPQRCGRKKGRAEEMKKKTKRRDDEGKRNGRSF